MGRRNGQGQREKQALNSNTDMRSRVPRLEAETQGAGDLHSALHLTRGCPSSGLPSDKSTFGGETMSLAQSSGDSGKVSGCLGGISCKTNGKEAVFPLGRCHEARGKGRVHCRTVAHTWLEAHCKSDTSQPLHPTSSSFPKPACLL